MRSLTWRAVVLLALSGLIACKKSSTPTSPSPGSSTVPGLTLSLASVGFSAQAVGTSSSAQTVTITNGSTPVTFASVVATGDFTQTNTCGTVLAATLSCSVSITFTPTAVGSRTGAVTITDDASTSPQVITLLGSGGVGEVAVTPTSLNFANLVVGTNASQTVTIRNSGGANVTIAGVTTTGDFTQSNACGTTLAAGASCIITVKFTPSGTGQRTGTLAVADDAAGTPHSVLLSGTGLAQAPTVAPLVNPLTFPAQAVGTSSRASTLQFQNLGTSVLVVSGISATGDFSQSNSCAATIQPNGICTMNVVFTPTAAGARTGTIAIASNAPGSPQIIVLNGTGTDASSGQGPVVSLSPPNLSYVNQPVSSSSAAQTVTLKNTGAAPLAIAGISTTDDFSQTNGCGASLAAAASCTIQVRFSPGSAGLHSGTLVINDSAPGSPHVVFLSGSGTGGIAPAVSLSSSNVGFGSVRLGATSDPQIVTVSNPGKATLNFSNIAVDGDFSSTDTCGYSIAAGASCTLTLRFTPGAIGTRTGKVTLADDAATSPQTIALSGTGGLGQVTLSAPGLTFAAQAVGTTSDAQTITLTNTGEISVTVASVAASGDFAQTNTCTDPIAAGGNCSITVTFTPTAAGPRSGLVTIVDDAPGSPHSLLLNGSGS